MNVSDNIIEYARWRGLHKATLSAHPGSTQKVYSARDWDEMVLRLRRTLKGIDWSRLDKPIEGGEIRNWRSEG